MSMGGGSSSNDTQSEGSGFNVGGNTSGSVNYGQGQNFGFNKGTSSSSSSQSSYSKDRIWDKQAPFLEDKYQQAQDMFNKQQPGVDAETDFAQGYIKDVQNGALDQWQNKLSDGNVNSYTDAMKNSIASDAGRAQDQMLGKMDARAAASGMSGGARHGTAVGQGMAGINDAMLREQANIGFQAEEAGRGRQMQALGMSGDMSNLGMQGFNPLGAQWGALQNYNNIVGDPTKLTDSGSSSSSSQTSNNYGSNYGQNQNLGFNFGMGQNYGENTNGAEGSGSSWNAKI